MTVQYFTITGSTTLSTTITGLNQGEAYYYTITAFNSTTPGPTSAVQTNSTIEGASDNLLLINGKIYTSNGMAAISGPSSPNTTTNYILNSTGGQILINGQILSHT
jgi:hypothetical protein